MRSNAKVIPGHPKQTFIRINHQENNMTRSEVKVNLSVPAGKIRKINGGNLGPSMLSNSEDHPYGDHAPDFAALNIPITRLHDAPYENPGRRLVDIPQIFPNMDFDAEDPANYYFPHTDDYIKEILDCGTQVMYRLGVSIEHGKKRYWCDKPKDVKKYAAVCANIIRHYNYGKWEGHHWNIQYWEIWNEPENWDWEWENDVAVRRKLPRQFGGTIEEFNEFYCELATILKNTFPELKFGGPSHGEPKKYAVDFLNYCKEHNAPLDFYSCHMYSDSVQKHKDMVFDVRKKLDDAGFKNTELHLNEWHYHPRHPAWYSKSPVKVQRKYLSGYYRESKGLNSAAMLCAVLTAWQDAPIDMGNYYTTGSANGYGLYDLYAPTPSYYGLKAFGEIVRYTERISCECEEPIYALAGHNEKGEYALLVSAYRTNTGCGRIRISFDSGVDISGVELLDEHNELDRIYFEQIENTVDIGYTGDSCVVLVKFTRK